MTEPVLFDMYRGDDYTLRVAIKDSLGIAVDVTGWQLTATMKISTALLDVDAPVQVVMPALTGADALVGVFYVHLPREQTANLVPTKYFFDLQRTFNDRVTTVFSGLVLIKPDVTRGV